MTEALPDSSHAVAARRVEPNWDAARSARNLSRVHVRRGQRQARKLAFGGAAMLVAAAALFVLVAGKRTAPPAAALPVAVATKSPKTTFVDGSIARVSDGGELVVKVA